MTILVRVAPTREDLITEDVQSVASPLCFKRAPRDAGREGRGGAAIVVSAKLDVTGETRRVLWITSAEEFLGSEYFKAFTSANRN